MADSKKAGSGSPKLPPRTGKIPLKTTRSPLGSKSSDSKGGKSKSGY